MLSSTPVLCRAFMDYQCGWYAPVLGEPESMANMMSGSENISITVGGVQGRIMPPVEANGGHASVVFV